MIKTGIKLEGDSSDAQRAFTRLRDDIRRTNGALSDFARESASIGFGVLGAGTIEEALSKVYDAAVESLKDFIERNREAAEVVEGTRIVLRDMADTFYEAALGGGNLESILGTIQIVAQELTGVFGDHQAAIRSAVLNGWVQLLETIPTVIGAYNGFRAVVDGARLVFVQFRMAIRIGIVALGDMGRAIHQGLLQVIRQLTQGLHNVIDTMSAMATAVDERMGTNLARPFELASARISDFESGLDGSIERLDEIGRINRAQIQTEVVEAQQASADIIRGIEDRENARQNLANSIANLVGRIRSGEVAEQAFTQAVGDGTEAIEEQAGSIQDLGAALGRYAERWLGFHEEFKQGLREEARLQEELNAWTMARYQASVDKQMELAEMRADAENAAQAKIQGAIDRTTEAYDRWASGSVDAFTLAIAGQQKFADAARASIGDVVAALADEARARAIAAGATGNFGAAAALGAASVAIGAIAATLGASRGGGGGGGGGSSQPTQVNNVSVQVLGGPLGVTQDQVRQLGEVVNEAIGRGVVRA